MGGWVGEEKTYRKERSSLVFGEERSVPPLDERLIGGGDIVGKEGNEEGGSVGGRGGGGRAFFSYIHNAFGIGPGITARGEATHNGTVFFGALSFRLLERWVGGWVGGWMGRLGRLIGGRRKWVGGWVGLPS